MYDLDKPLWCSRRRHSETGVHLWLCLKPPRPWQGIPALNTESPARLRHTPRANHHTPPKQHGNKPSLSKPLASLAWLQTQLPGTAGTGRGTGGLVFQRVFQRVEHMAGCRCRSLGVTSHERQWRFFSTEGDALSDRLCRSDTWARSEGGRQSLCQVTWCQLSQCETRVPVYGDALACPLVLALQSR